MRGDAPHCLIKQKVDLFKSNFAQGLGGVRGRGGWWGGDQQTGPRAEKGTACVSPAATGPFFLDTEEGGSGGLPVKGCVWML